MKYSKKHRKIIKTILERGKYKPTYSDEEPATQTLIRQNIIEWNGSFTGVILTEQGKQKINEILNEN